MKISKNAAVYFIQRTILSIHIQLGLIEHSIIKNQKKLEIEGTPVNFIIILTINKHSTINSQYYHLTDNQQVSLNKLKIISEELQRYKTEHGLVDFPDMIEKFLSGGDTPKLRVMFVDEAQDLSLIQWKLVRRIEESSTDSFIAGDDDQGIYKWNGAHVNTFINLEGTREILEQSHRVPQKPFELANKIINKVKNRVAKKYYPKDKDRICKTLSKFT